MMPSAENKNRQKKETEKKKGRKKWGGREGGSGGGEGRKEGKQELLIIASNDKVLEELQYFLERCWHTADCWFHLSWSIPGNYRQNISR